MSDVAQSFEQRGRSVIRNACSGQAGTGAEGGQGRKSEPRPSPPAVRRTSFVEIGADEPAGGPDAEARSEVCPRVRQVQEEDATGSPIASRLPTFRDLPVQI